MRQHCAPCHPTTAAHPGGNGGSGADHGSRQRPPSRTSRGLSLVLALLGCQAGLQAGEPPPTLSIDAAAGVVTVAHGPYHTRLQAGPAGALRLTSAKTPEALQTAPGVAYLPGAVTPAQIREAADHVLVTTPLGAWRIDRAQPRFSVLDGQGRVLLADLRLSTHAPRGRDPTGENWVLHGPAVPEGERWFGGGNAHRRQVPMVIDQAETAHGNGNAGIPVLWSEGGWLSLVNVGDARARIVRNQRGEHEWLAQAHSGIDVAFAPTASLAEGLGLLASISGAAPVPPAWAFGLLHSKWGWRDRAQHMAAQQGFRSRGIGLDAFIYDFEWYTPTPDYELKNEGLQDFLDFGFNPRLFPNPAADLAEMRERQVQFIPIRKPRLGNSQLLAMARERGWTLGNGREIDFRIPEVRAWYRDQLKPLLDLGVAGWWNDEGEQFATQYHWWTSAQLDAHHRFRPGERFWAINRSATLGDQRLGAAMWNGDTKATWADLRGLPSQMLRLGLSGQPYAGSDVGGFHPVPSPELLVRWTQASVYLPLIRPHSSMRGGGSRLPWDFGPEAEQALSQALALRYRLLPTLYGLAHEAAATGLPLSRALALAFPQERDLATIDDQWLLGSSLLAAPLLATGGEREVRLPRGPAAWYRFPAGPAAEPGATLTLTAGLAEIPAWLASGGLVVLTQDLQWADPADPNPWTIHIGWGADATFTTVEDDGRTDAHLRGERRRITWRWDQAERRLSASADGTWPGAPRQRALQVVIHGAPADLRLGGQPGEAGDGLRRWSAGTWDLGATPWTWGP